jgi:formamidopyrimidine-DNA glycosylase
VFAGVGNIYAAEALFHARLSPFARGRDLDDHSAGDLVDAAVLVLREAVQRRGTSFSDYVDGEGKQGDNLAYLMVFRREGEPCRRCAAVVLREVQGQRSTFYCARCQGAGR